ncbi:hypothetical protein Ancab_018878 [Ancistrocladus abbreviatus]
MASLFTSQWCPRLRITPRHCPFVQSSLETFTGFKFDQQARTFLESTYRYISEEIALVFLSFLLSPTS